MKLKKWIVPVCSISLLFTACLKSNNNDFNQQQQNKLDDQAIQTYLVSHNIVAQRDTLFDLYKDTVYVYSKIDSLGHGTDSTTIKDTAIVNITGKLLDGTVFYKSQDSTNATRLDTIYLSSTTSNLLTGALQYGITLLKPGGGCHIYAPSVFGYGYYGFPSVIPSNAPLVYDIILVDVKHAH